MKSSCLKRCAGSFQQRGIPARAGRPPPRASPPGRSTSCSRWRPGRRRTRRARRSGAWDRLARPAAASGHTASASRSSARFACKNPPCLEQTLINVAMQPLKRSPATTVRARCGARYFSVHYWTTDISDRSPTASSHRRARSRPPSPQARGAPYESFDRDGARPRVRPAHESSFRSV
jgi:hypothetical protein